MRIIPIALALTVALARPLGAAPAAPGPSPSFGAILSQILSSFEFLQPLLEGGDIAITQLGDVFPFLASAGIDIGELNLPLLEEIDADLEGRSWTLSDDFFGLGSNIPDAAPTEFLRARARIAIGEGVAGTLLSETGQEAAAEALDEVRLAAEGVATDASDIATLSSMGQSATTTFDRIGYQLEQRRAAALQAQREAEIDAKVFSALQQNGTLMASLLEVTSQTLQADLSNSVTQLRQHRGSSALLRNARAGALVFGGTP